jgi:hypothetical protein
MPSSQRHCPYDGRWLGRPDEVCARPACRAKLEAEVVALVAALEQATAHMTVERRTARATLDDMRLNGVASWR